MVDTLDAARSFGLQGGRVELAYERFDAQTLGVQGDAGVLFVSMLNAWIELTGVLNELSRSMGLADFYPFVLSAPAARKLLFVHRVVAAAPGTPLAPSAASPAPHPDEAAS
jgi:hypothetical protein